MKGRLCVAVVLILSAVAPLPAQELGLSFDLIAEGRDINGVQDITALAVSGDSIYTCYVTAALEVVVAKRLLSGGPWSASAPIHTGNADDAHNTCSLGVDPAGYVHVAYDMHSSAINYRRSSQPGGLVLGTFPMPVPADRWVTYPRFYRAGSRFYFLYRDGISANGDVVFLELVAGAWQVVADPLIAGSSMTPTDNPYLGAAMPAANGDLYICWTHRRDWWNAGVYFGRWDAAARVWRWADGSAYSLPITRATADAVLGPDDPFVSYPSNVGLAVVLDDGAPKVAYAAHRHGHREIFFAVWSADAWKTTQVTHAQAERLRACPGGDMEVPTRPCDMEVQGPAAFAFGAGRVALLYGVSVRQSRGVWARPPALMRAAWSGDGGHSWSDRVLRQNVELLAGELPRESGGAPYFLHQVAGSPSGALYLGTLDTRVSLPVPRVEASGSQFPIELADGPSWRAGPAMTVSAWMIPDASGHEMSILDKGGLVGNRELRLLIWGAPAPLHYDPAYLQIGIGDASGNWGLLWYPSASGVAPGLLSHVAVTWDGQTVALYVNGAPMASTPYSGVGSDGAAPVLIGANLLGSGAVDTGRVYSGWLKVSHFAEALAPAEIANLYAAGPR